MKGGNNMATEQGIKIKAIVDEYGAENIHRIIIDNSRNYYVEFQEDATAGLVRNFIDYASENLIQMRDIPSQNYGDSKYGEKLFTVTPFDNIQGIDFVTDSAKGDQIISALLAKGVSTVEIVRKKRF